MWGRGFRPSGTGVEGPSLDSVEQTSRGPAAGPVGYRWVVLVAFMAVNLTIQVLWIS